MSAKGREVPAPIFKGAATAMERVRPGEEDGPRRTVGLRAITPASLAGAQAEGVDDSGPESPPTLERGAGPRRPGGELDEP